MRGSLLALMLAIGACKRVPTTVAPMITSVLSTVQGTAQGTPTEVSSQPVPLATSTSTVQATQVPYPVVTYPTQAAQTEETSPPPSEQILLKTETATPTPSTTPLSTYTHPPTAQIQATLTASPSESPVLPAFTATETPPWMYPAPEVSPYPTSAETESYPGPIINPAPTSANTEPYPGPVNTPTTQSGQGPLATPTQRATRTPSGSITPPTPGGGGGVPSPTPYQITGTPGATPTELPPRPPLSPPPAGSSVTIWHSWSAAETDVLRQIIRSFQRAYPDVTFTLTIVPLDDLESTYLVAAYPGQGPSILLGPANWGPELFNQTVVADLKPFIPDDYLADINPAGLSSGEYHDALISLPLSLHGTVLFRNNTLITTSPASVEELIDLSRQATHGGFMGSYLERGSNVSAANIIGLGGALIGQEGNPLFDDAFGLQWFDLLDAYDEAGAVTFNTNRDLQMFKRGRVGIIIDDSSKISQLAQTLGAENLSIDPWPAFGSGHMAGWVEADSIYLNANTTGDDRFAALAFMGYLLDPNIQMRLAEVGHIPSVLTTQPRDRLIREAMEAFIGGEPYPITTDSTLLNLYWSELDKAIRDVTVRGVDPQTALESARIKIEQTLRALRTIP